MSKTYTEEEVFEFVKHAKIETIAMMSEKLIDEAKTMEAVHAFLNAALIACQASLEGSTKEESLEISKKIIKEMNDK